MFIVAFTILLSQLKSVIFIKFYSKEMLNCWFYPIIDVNSVEYDFVMKNLCSLVLNENKSFSEWKIMGPLMYSGGLCMKWYEK